jgi:hypothetical protein
MFAIQRINQIRFVLRSQLDVGVKLGVTLSLFITIQFFHASLSSEIEIHLRAREFSE